MPFKIYQENEKRCAQVLAEKRSYQSNWRDTRVILYHSVGWGNKPGIIIGDDLFEINIEGKALKELAEIVIKHVQQFDRI